MVFHDANSLTVYTSHLGTAKVHLIAIEVLNLTTRSHLLSNSFLLLLRLTFNLMKMFVESKIPGVFVRKLNANYDCMCERVFWL